MHFMEDRHVRRSQAKVPPAAPRAAPKPYQAYAAINVTATVADRERVIAYCAAHDVPLRKVVLGAIREFLDRNNG